MDKQYIIFMQNQMVCMGVFKKELSGHRILVENPAYVSFRVAQDEEGHLRGGVDVQPWLHGVALQEGCPNEWEILINSNSRATALDPSFIGVYEGVVAMTSDRAPYMESQHVAIPNENSPVAEEASTEA